MDPTLTTREAKFGHAFFAGNTLASESARLALAIGRTLKHANHGLRRRLGGSGADSGDAAGAERDRPRLEIDPVGTIQLDAQTRWRLALELEPGEQLLWAGRPYRGWRFHSLDFLLVPLGVLGSVVAVIAAAAAWGHSPAPNAARLGQEAGGLVRTLSALPAISVAASGFYLSFGRLIADACRRANTSYGLTPQRIIIINGTLRRNVTSIALDNLGHFTFSHHDDGSGTIRFGERSGLRPWHFPGLPVAAQPEFERVANVRKVLRQITLAQRGTLASPASSGLRPASPKSLAYDVKTRAQSPHPAAVSRSGVLEGTGDRSR